MTSRNTSFFRYLMPSDRQETALVTVAGGLGAPVSSLWPSCVIYLEASAQVRGMGMAPTPATPSMSVGPTFGGQSPQT